MCDASLEGKGWNASLVVALYHPPEEKKVWLEEEKPSFRHTPSTLATQSKR